MKIKNMPRESRQWRGTQGKPLESVAVCAEHIYQVSRAYISRRRILRRQVVQLAQQEVDREIKLQVMAHNRALTRPKPVKWISISVGSRGRMNGSVADCALRALPRVQVSDTLGLPTFHCERPICFLKHSYAQPARPKAIQNVINVYSAVFVSYLWRYYFSSVPLFHLDCESFYLNNK